VALEAATGLKTIRELATGQAIHPNLCASGRAS
jgi:hypothetical protein